MYQPNIRFFITLQLAFYISSLVFLLAVEKRRTDFKQMVAHHFVTVTMMTLALKHRHRNITLIVLHLHDITDVFLYGAKSLYYSEAKGKTVMFSLFVVSFFLLRLVYYPMIVRFYLLPCIVKGLRGGVMRGIFLFDFKNLVLSLKMSFTCFTSTLNQTVFRNKEEMFTSGFCWEWCCFTCRGLQ